MHRSEIVQDIYTSVHHAIAAELYMLDESALVARSDAMLQSLPVMGDEEPTTALLLQRYHAQLHQELCVGNHPRVNAETVEDELRELTRAVVVTVGSEEGLSVDSSTLIALVLYKYGLPAFCNLPLAPSATLDT